MSLKTRPRYGKVSVDLGKPEITIQLRPPDPPKENQDLKISKKLLRVLFSLAATIGVLLLVFVYPTNRIGPQSISPNIRVSYVAPKYISKGDENTIQVTVINSSPTESYNGTVTLNFSYSAIPILATSENGVSISIKDLPPGGRITRPIKFKLPIETASKTVDYYFQVTPSEENFQSALLKNKFLVMPYPLIYLRTILEFSLSAIGGTGIVTVILNLFWDRIKKYFGASKITEPKKTENQ